MRRIAQLLVLSLASLLLFAGLVALVSCAKTDPVVAVAYAAMPKTWDRTELVDWRKAEVTALDVPAGSKRLIAAFTTTPGAQAVWIDLAGRSVWRVMFRVKEPSVLGPIVVYVDRETNKALGFDPRS